MTALLLGDAPELPLGFSYVDAAPYQAVLVGSLRIGALLHFDCPDALRALLEGIPVYVWLPGLEHRQLGPEGSPALYAKCLAKERELAQWGVRFLRGRPRPPLITARQAKRCGMQGLPENARLTPLARDILGGKG